MSKSSTPDTPTEPDFETALGELEALVEQLESGELALADALGRFERGIALSRQCHELLEQARLKVTQLQNPEDQGSEVPFAELDPD